MAKKTLPKEEIFEIDKDAFKGPFTCHGKTKLLKKQTEIKMPIENSAIFMVMKTNVVMINLSKKISLLVAAPLKVP